MEKIKSNNGNGFHPDGRPKHAGGRPKDDLKARLPEGWEDIILDLCAKGKADVQIRAHLCMMGGKFDHHAWYKLKDLDQQFKETLYKGRSLQEAWWINILQDNILNNKLQTFAWFANMKNRFSEHWKDKVDVEHSGDLTVNYGHRTSTRALRN